jgi:hypothetical protein
MECVVWILVGIPAKANGVHAGCVVKKHWMLSWCLRRNPQTADVAEINVMPSECYSNSDL